MLFLGSAIRKCRKELEEIRAIEYRLRNEDDDIQMQIGDLFDFARLLADQYIVDDYSVAVWNRCTKKNPWLIRVETGEAVRWKAAFPDLWENMVPEQKRSLVALIEGGGEYRFRWRPFGMPQSGE